VRAVVLSVLVAAALVVGGSLGGAAAASHLAKKPSFRDARAPSWSPDGKEIAFTYTRSVKEKNCCGIPGSWFRQTRYRIVRKSRPGGAIHTVVSGEGYCCGETRWLPSGRLLFTSGVFGFRSVSPGGGKSRRIDFPDCPGVPPVKCGEDGYVLSPHGKYAAVGVVTTEPHTVPGIALLKLRRGRVPVLVPTRLAAEEAGGTWDDRLLGFSPDGRQVVFSRSAVESLDPPADGPPTLLAISLDGGEPVPLTQTSIPGASLVPNDARQLQWSPDGRWIAFVENDNLEVGPTTGETARVLPACGSGVDHQWDISWSPTSKQLAYACFAEDGAAPFRQTRRFMTISPDATNPTDLLEGHPLAYGGEGLFAYFDRFQWSPDGSRLLFVAHRISHRPTHIWTIRPDGHDLTRIG
jgi:Tol biopolymer transport system component